MARSVVLTSGTLSPLDTFASELQTKFSIRMEAKSRDATSLRKRALLMQPETGQPTCTGQGSNLTTSYDEDGSHPTTRHPQNGRSTDRQQQFRHPQHQNSSNGQEQQHTTLSGSTSMADWILALGLDPNTPIHVIGYFGKTRDLTMFERVDRCGKNAAIAQIDAYDTPSMTRNTKGMTQLGSTFDSDDLLPVYTENNLINYTPDRDTDVKKNTGVTLGLGNPQQTGDIQVYLDRSKSTLMLQHDYLFDSEELISECHETIETIGKDYTSTELSIDPRITSVLLALATTKRQIHQELDKFLAICWDRLGITSSDPPGYTEQGGQNHSSGNRNSGNASSNASHPAVGRSVPVVIFVIERVPITYPWFEEGANESQIVDQLRVQLKKSVDAIQTRLRYIFKACRLIQSIESSGNAYDGRQLFVLPAPSSMPFVHAIPYFTGAMNFSAATQTPIESYSNNILDPAEAVLRQKLQRAKVQSGGLYPRKKMQHQQHESSSTMFGMPTTTLDDVYTAILSAKDQPLASGTGLEGSSGPSMSQIYSDYSGLYLKQFLEGWMKAVTSPAGYGNIKGKRNVVHVEVPTLQQWVATYLGISEALGYVAVMPRHHLMPSPASAAQSTREEGLNGKFAEMNISGASIDISSAGNNTVLNVATGREGREGRGQGGGRRSGNNKRYSQRTSNMVQKKIRDFVQSDDVMEELYGQKPEMASTTRSYSDRYHQIKADQATKLFQSLAHRR
ncbi:hypothetical protein BGZ94_010048 [Podila epigama]|nr:hypothetical protein BGZ94_010048 [Podila epigama]